ncbi:MAG: hypothetical protein Q9197_001257 [Variospora fuerteventurae]
MPVADAQQQGRDGDGRNRDPRSPSPDPSNKSSPHIVIPPTEIYGSQTPSPLSPITPSDRLSPIEEVDDNASLLSTCPKKGDHHAGTGGTRDSRPPQTRPTSGDFELPNSIETNATPPSLEARSELLFSRQHLELIFADKELSKRFGTFLRTYRPDSVPILGYYLDTIKALRTLKYAEAVVKNIERIPGLDFTADAKGVAMTWVLEDKADRVLDILTKNDLPAFVAYVYVSIVDVALVERVTGKADMEANDVAVGLAEVFTISDPARPDNPLVFASEEFHRMTQYPSNKALGRNCRFLGGPKTDPNAIARLKVSLEAEREHCEVMLNYRRDGSPFINLVMVVPLRDQNGRVRYHLGAQLDITELVNTCTGLESFQKLLLRQSGVPKGNPEQHRQDEIRVQLDQMTEFQQLSETFTTKELQSLLGSQERQQLDDQVKHGLKGYSGQSNRVRNSSANLDGSIQLQGFGSAPPLGFYQNYLLIRPHPSLRILFASPDLRLPGILQSPLMEQIGGSPRVRDDLYHALEAGQKVTAKVQWLSKSSHEARSRWIHCTPLISANGLIGVWMVILVDDDEEPPTAAAAASPEPLPRKSGPKDFSAPTPWESPKANHSPRQKEHSPSTTTNSSQTAFSDPAKPAAEKVPSPIREDPEKIDHPFAEPKPWSVSAAISVTDLKFDDQVTGMDWVEPDHPRQSADSLTWSRPRHSSNRYDPPPNLQTLHVRPGPRIAGKAYSFNSNNENGISADDEPSSINSRGGADRPTSQASSVSAPRTNIRTPEFRWRKVEDQPQRMQSRGGPAPIRLPGRASQDTDVARPAVWKTKKKSLSPYGFLLDDD